MKWSIFLLLIFVFLVGYIVGVLNHDGAMGSIIQHAIG